MMTEKEMAQTILREYLNIVEDKIIAMSCALNCVTRIIMSNPYNIVSDSPNSDYYYNVREELKKL